MNEQDSLLGNRPVLTTPSEPEIKAQEQVPAWRKLVFVIVLLVCWSLVLGFLSLMAAFGSDSGKSPWVLLLPVFIAALSVMSIMTRKAFVKTDIMPLIGAVPLVYITSMITLAVFSLFTSN